MLQPGHSSSQAIKPRHSIALSAPSLADSFSTPLVCTILLLLTPSAIGLIRDQLLMDGENERQIVRVFLTLRRNSVGPQCVSRLHRDSMECGLPMFCIWIRGDGGIGGLVRGCIFTSRPSCRIPFLGRPLAHDPVLSHSILGSKRVILILS